MGWNTVSQNWGMFIVFNLLAMLIIDALTGTVVGIIVAGPFVIGMHMFYLRAARGEEKRYETLFEPLSKGDFLNTMILYLLKTVFIMLWTLLFIVPGIIKSYAYSMAEYIYIDDPTLSSNECLAKSQTLMEGNKGKLFLLDLSFIGWILLSILTFGILSLWVAPYQQATRAAFYEDIKAQARI
jgi:uncharacterized membrane protein